jgi:protocatechuate 3,4-dioxygenase beta subunit
MRTPEQVLGPYFPVGPLPTQGGDLVTGNSREGHPDGEIIEIVGRVLNCDGEPVRGAKLIIWQANSFGRYAHPNDANPAPLDPNFDGFGKVVSNDSGDYRIRTVKPGAYPARADWMRPPHIHFDVWGKFERLITQMYFPGEPLNACDRILMSASDPHMLIAQPLSSAHGEIGRRPLKFDIVLARG